VSKYLFTGNEWDVPLIKNVWDRIQTINEEKYGFEYTDSQMEVVTYDQMLYLYSTNGLPVMYPHWSFGAHHTQFINDYKNKKSGLALEMIINTEPPIAYLMENNSAAAQTMVLAHASVGHAAFFKNNYLFKQWTRPSSIIAYLNFAKEYISEMSTIHGQKHVERILDSCHALENYGVFHYKRPPATKKKVDEKIQYYYDNRDQYWYGQYLDTYDEIKYWYETEGQFPQENFLYFIEKNSMVLKKWEKEIVRIVYTIRQYFYPQIQTKIANEGFATWCGYEICKDLYEQGYITDSAYLEILELHTAVIMQPDYNYGGQGFTQLNPYKIGYEIFKDIQNRYDDHLDKIKDVVANYRDDSFVRQYLTKDIIDNLDLFAFELDTTKSEMYYDVQEILGTSHDEEELVKFYADLLLMENLFPRLEIIRFDKLERIVWVQYKSHMKRKFDPDQEDNRLVQIYFEELTGYIVKFVDVDRV
jgi:spore cortex formation protein SpoVR/YcgB (stage V sporulation)